jgi:hypothetical protein
MGGGDRVCGVRPRAGGGLTAFGVLHLSACAWPADEDRLVADLPPLAVVETVPRAGAIGVTPEQTIDLCMSAVLAPGGIVPTDALLTSGANILDSELLVQIVPWLGPGGGFLQASAEPWCPGSVVSVRPVDPLVEGVRYRMTLAPTPVGWDGERLDTDAPPWIEGTDGPHLLLEFTVGASGEPPVPAADPVTLTQLFAAGGPFDPDRAQCSCHTQPGEPAHDRLDLSDPTVAYAGLLGDARPHDTGYPYVSPGSPSESFLVHKLLRDEDGGPMRGIFGDAMPPDEPLPAADLRAILRWIADGAVP